MFNYLWRSSENIRALYETPTLAVDEDCDCDREAARRSSTRSVPTAGRPDRGRVEARALRLRYPDHGDGRSGAAEDAVAAAERIGDPVVLKLFSRATTDKTDVGGVTLDLTDAAGELDTFAATAIRSPRSVAPSTSAAYRPAHDQLHRLRARSWARRRTPSRPVLLFGAGGQRSRSSRTDRSACHRSHALARRMIEKNRTPRPSRASRPPSHRRPL